MMAEYRRHIWCQEAVRRRPVDRSVEKSFDFRELTVDELNETEKKMKSELLLSAQPLLLSAADAGRVLGISERHFYGLHSTGRLGPLPVKLGKRTLWSRIELEEWVASKCPCRQDWIKRDRSSVDSPA